MKQNKTQKVMKYIAKHPNAKAGDVAKATGVGVSYVYTVMSKAKKKAEAVSDLAFQLTQGRSKMRGRPPMRMRTVAIGLSDFSVKDRMINTHAKDNVNHPEHYKMGGIETIDFIEAKSLGYHLGNVVKYVTRADHKGNRLEDLKKAQWYLNRAVANLEK
jgi:hypothetical protein